MNPELIQVNEVDKVEFTFRNSYKEIRKDGYGNQPDKVKILHAMMSFSRTLDDFICKYLLFIEDEDKKNVFVDIKELDIIKSSFLEMKDIIIENHNVPLTDNYRKIITEVEQLLFPNN